MNSEKIERLKKIVRSFEIHSKINCNISVKYKGNYIINATIGYQDYENKILLTPNSVFQISSLTKAFTALTILLLIEHNQISIKDNIKDFFPNFPYEEITIENLLSHTSGITDFRTDPFVLDNLIKYDYLSNHKLIDIYCDLQPKLCFVPKSGWLYSNTGYVILASIIELVSGSKLNRVFKSLIFDPLNMADSIIPNSHDEINNNKFLAQGYFTDKKKTEFSLAYTIKPKIFSSIGYLYGDCGIYSTLTDLQRFYTELTMNEVFQKHIIQQCFEPYKLANGRFCDYGYGWMVYYSNSKKIVSHTGSLSGYACEVIKYLDDDIDIIFLSNLDNVCSNRDIFIPEIHKVIIE